jgi:amidohydrolase
MMMQIDRNTIRQLTDLRHHLHRNPELSGQEAQTALTITEFLETLHPDTLLTGIGGHGVAAVFSGSRPGPSILLRADMDALPIPETIDIGHQSVHQGISHKCGHDGHMTILAGTAQHLAENRPRSGQVILLFQPSEETGEGASRILNDPAFQAILPDCVFALHNLPGYPRDSVIVKKDCFAAASTGIIVRYLGKTAHAGEPDKGINPAQAVSQLVNSLSAVPQFDTGFGDASKVTVIHAKLGERAFGTSPGEAVVMATLRAANDAMMLRLEDECSQLAAGIGKTYKLDTSITTTEAFPATVNNDMMVDIILNAASAAGMQVIYRDHPFPWSEDFGQFTNAFPGALFGLGAGEHQPALHHPDYDFPDTLIPGGIRLFAEIPSIIELVLNKEGNADQTSHTDTV